MSDEAWRRGFDRLEYVVKEAGRQGKEIWPPSYAAFLGYCEKPAGEMAHKLLPSNLDPKAPPLLLPDKDSQERAKKAGRENLDQMKQLF